MGKDKDKEEEEEELLFYVDLAEEDLVGEGAVDVGGVEEGDAGADGVANEGDHVGLRLGRPVERRHAHATQPLRRHLQPLRPQPHPPHRRRRHICSTS